MRIIIVLIMERKPDEQKQTAFRSHPPKEVRCVDSKALLAPHGELLIQHQGREYRLRLTQSGKLILTA